MWFNTTAGKRIWNLFSTLQVIDENVSYQDGLDMTTEDLYERLRQQHTPKTSIAKWGIFGKKL